MPSELLSLNPPFYIPTKFEKTATISNTIFIKIVKTVHLFNRWAVKLISIMV